MTVPLNPSESTTLTGATDTELPREITDFLQRCVAQLGIHNQGTKSLRSRAIELLTVYEKVETFKPGDVWRMRDGCVFARPLSGSDVWFGLTRRAICHGHTDNNLTGATLLMRGGTLVRAAVEDATDALATQDSIRGV